MVWRNPQSSLRLSFVKECETRDPQPPETSSSRAAQNNFQHIMMQHIIYVDCAQQALLKKIDKCKLLRL